MLTTLGKRSREQSSVTDRLLDCHARIRKFCALALRLGAGAPSAQARDAAEQLHRYFSIALPLHIADEDDSVRPRLERLGDPSVDAALGSMTIEHVEIETTLDVLLDSWLAIAKEPTDARCLTTRVPAMALERQMLPHLHDEESFIFPALASLPPGQAEKIVAEMQARRRP